VAAVVTVAACIGLGVVGGRLLSPVAHGQYFPWIAGRALGLAAYAALWALVIVGLWWRHPWRLRRGAGHAEMWLRLHAALGAAAVVLVAGHLTALALDAYAGVGLSGAFVPGMSAYRTLPVAIGTLSFYGMLLIAASARLAPRLLGARWLGIHRLSALVYTSAFVHGVASGTDTPALRLAYAATGLVVVVAWSSRHLARSVEAPGRARALEPA
jgi:hypothetical protein